MAAITPDQLRALIATLAPDQEDWAQAFLDMMNGQADLAEGVLAALAAAGPGTALVLPAMTAAQILAWPQPLEGLEAPCSDDGSRWAYHAGAWRQLPSRAQTLLGPRLVSSWDFNQNDANQPEDASLGASQCILLAHGARRRVMLQERVMQPGLGLRLVLLLAMSSTDTANLSLNWAYRVVGPGQGLGLAVDFWQAGKVYTAGAQVIGLTAEGWRAFSAAGGTSGATEPTWPSAGNVADNGWNWAAGELVFKNLALSLPVTAQAGQGFWVDDLALQIPAAELTSADQMLVGFLWVPAASPHPGGLHLLDAWLRPVEV